MPNTNGMPLGSEVTWINEETKPVIVSGDGWQSPPLKPGEKFTKIFDSAGKFSYFNSSSTKIKGELVIQ